MIGTKIMGFGILLLISGAAFLGMYFLQLITTPIVFTAGRSLFIIGFLTMMSGSLTALIPKAGIRVGDQNAFSLALLRCMIAISIADDFLDDDEVKEISRIYTHLIKNDIDEQVIRDTAADMKDNDTSIETELMTVVDTLDNPHKEKLVIASLYILAADGDMDERELMMLDDIRLGLKLSLRQVDKIKSNFLSKRDLKEV